MSTKKRPYTAELLSVDPAAFGAALAHLIAVSDGKDVVLGQAWLAGPSHLVTCGHIVDSFKDNPEGLTIRFPSSANRYPVRQVKLHPRFVRQADGLVKFDAAVIYLDLRAPEIDVEPLPIVFGKPIAINQQLSAFRYPVHLATLSESPAPLTQFGRMLGPLRTDDGFHLLHDLSLTAGDSGTPIFDGRSIVGLHCGDTATIPGLNLPTTAIRLLLWVEALKEMDLKETAVFPSAAQPVSPLSLAVALLAAFVVAFAVGTYLGVVPKLNRWDVKQAAVLPVDITFNKPLDQYKVGDICKMVVAPRSDCYLYVFDVTESRDPAKHSSAYLLYPPYLPSGLKSFVHAGQSRAIDGFGSSEIVVQQDKGKLHLVAFKKDTALLTDRDFVSHDPSTSPLAIPGEELVKRIQLLESQNPSEVLHSSLDAPSGN